MQEDTQLGDKIEEIKCEASLNDIKSFYDECAAENKGKTVAAYGIVYRLPN